MSDTPKKVVRISKYNATVLLRVTSQMKASMEKIAQDRGYAYTSTIWRDAIESYLEQESNEIGSRRFFTKTISDRLDRMEGLLVLIGIVILKAVISGFSILLQAVGAPAPEGSTWEEGPYFARTIQGTFRDMSSMEQTIDKLFEKVVEAKEKTVAHNKNKD